MIHKPKIAISSCLLGEKVRYNGAHKKEDWIVDHLANHVEFIPVCPEMEMGLGSPREPMHLRGETPEDVNLIGSTSQTDFTKNAFETSKRLVERLKIDHPDGFILMKKSPSCSLLNIALVSKSGKNPKFTAGIYGQMVKEGFPETPKMESGHLRNPVLREFFLRQVFALFRFENEVSDFKTLQDFHRRYKYILMEHNQEDLRKLGRLLSNRKADSFESLIYKYKSQLIHTLEKKPKDSNKLNVLYHLMGYIKKQLRQDQKKKLIQNFVLFSDGKISYSVAKMNLATLIDQNEIEYLSDHYYFQPFPTELNINLSHVV